MCQVKIARIYKKRRKNRNSNNKQRFLSGKKQTVAKFKRCNVTAQFIVFLT